MMSEGTGPGRIAMFARIVLSLALVLPSIAWASPWQGLSIGLGGSTGYDFKWDKPCASPTVSLAAEVGGPRVRGWFGLDSAPLFWMGLGYDVVGAPLAMLTLGLNGGSEQTRIGGYVTGGMIGVGGGVQARFLPWLDKTGGRHGFDVRADWLAPEAVRTTVMYTWRAGFGLKTD